MTHQTLITVLVIIGLLIVAAGALTYFVLFEPWGTDFDETDFDTDAERIEFMQKILTLPIPSEATNIRLKYSQWQDWYLHTSFSLPATAFGEFETELEKHEPDGPNRWQVLHDDEIGHVETYTLDPAPGTVTAQYMTQ